MQVLRTLVRTALFVSKTTMLTDNYDETSHSGKSK